MRALTIPAYVDALVDFANLDSGNPQDVSRFQLKHRNFFPERFWTYRATDMARKPYDELHWVGVQKRVREVWDRKFRLGTVELMELLLRVFDPAMTFDALIYKTGYQPPFADWNAVTALQDAYLFHPAVRFLAEGPAWRVHKCEGCGQRCVRDHNAQRFCSVNCSKHAERKRHNAWSKAHNWGHPSKAKARRTARLPVFRQGNKTR